MKVKEAIEELQKLNQDDDVIIAWWTNDALDVPEEHWSDLTEHVEECMDWSASHDDISRWWDEYKSNYLE